MNHEWGDGTGETDFRVGGGGRHLSVRAGKSSTNGSYSKGVVVGGTRKLFQWSANPTFDLVMKHHVHCGHKRAKDFS